MTRLITFRPSHYCEKARWALDRAGHSYREEGHVPILSWVATFGAGARRTVPALVTGEGRVLPDSTDILRWADPILCAGDAAALEDDFDRRLGPATRRLVYFHVLPDEPRMRTLLARSDVGWEKRVAPLMFSLIRAGIRYGLKITAEGADRSRRVVDETFAGVSRRLADGRPYLLGDTFSAADLTFAALAYPVLWPDALPAAGIVPPFDELPASLRALMEELRATPGGRFALRLYDEERGPIGAGARN